MRGEQVSRSLAPELVHWVRSVWGSCVFSWCGSRAAAPSCCKEEGPAPLEELAKHRQSWPYSGPAFFLCVQHIWKPGGWILDVLPQMQFLHRNANTEGRWHVGVWPLQMFSAAAWTAAACLHLSVVLYIHEQFCGDAGQACSVSSSWSSLKTAVNQLGHIFLLHPSINPPWTNKADVQPSAFIHTGRCCIILLI